MQHETQEQTYDQTHNAVEDLLFKKDDSGVSRFEREVKSAFFSGIGKWVMSGGVAVIVLLAGIYYQVQNNSNLIDEGGRYTQEEADRDNENVQRQIDGISDDLGEIKDDIQYIREAVTR